MTTYDGKGLLFRNEQKETPKHPDYSGSATLNGVEYRIAGWINEGKSGKKYLALKFQPKDDQQIRPPMGNSPGRVSRSEELNDDIPF